MPNAKWIRLKKNRMKMFASDKYSQNASRQKKNCIGKKVLEKMPLYNCEIRMSIQIFFLSASSLCWVFILFGRSHNLMQDSHYYCACSINNWEVHFMFMNEGQPEHIYSFVNFLAIFSIKTKTEKIHSKIAKNCKMCVPNETLWQRNPFKDTTHQSACGNVDWIRLTIHTFVKVVKCRNSFRILASKYSSHCPNCKFQCLIFFGCFHRQKKQTYKQQLRYLIIQVQSSQTFKIWIQIKIKWWKFHNTFE